VSLRDWQENSWLVAHQTHLALLLEHELPLTTTGKLQKNRLASTFFADRPATG
jgi:hypothetical protein